MPRPVIPNPNPSKTTALLLRLLAHLTAPAPAQATAPASPASPAWAPGSIHLFGFAQGATAAGELALAWNKAHPSTPLGSVVSVSGPLLSHPTAPAKAAGTKVLLAMRRRESREMGAASWGKAFGGVKEVVWERGEGMPRGAEEWREVMR